MAQRARLREGARIHSLAGWLAKAGSTLRANPIAKDEEALAEVTDELTARLVAGQVLVVQRVLARRNWLRLVEGETAEQVHPSAVAAADHAFRLLPELG
jgi:hypothetical protein